MAKPNELYHHGVDGMKWGKRNGPPYPLDGDGKAALKEQKKEEKRQKNMARGEERLENRKDYVNKKYDIDRQATKLGMHNIKKTGELQKQVKDIKSIADEIKANPARLEAFGKRTHQQRVATISASSVAAGAAIVAGLAIEGTLVGTLPAAAIAGVGAAIYRQTKH